MYHNNLKSLFLPTPKELHAALPLNSIAFQTVSATRQQLHSILNKQDDRLIVIVGPCSIHDTNAALTYAEKLAQKATLYKQQLCILMRAYVEKSRTATGWKGLVNDPDLNNTFLIPQGLILARKLLLTINEMGLSVAAEIVDPLITPFLSDLIGWYAIGARNSESGIYRDIASHLPIPVGIKNSTEGNIQIAVNAIKTIQESHRFLSIDDNGLLMMIQSTGNPYGHIILRGSESNTNYEEKYVREAIASLKSAHLNTNIMIDCSHGNSHKDPQEQMVVAKKIAGRIAQGEDNLCGIMLESYLNAGKQPWDPQQKPQPDISITDACIGWHETEYLLAALNEAVIKKRETHTLSQETKTILL